jgi:hypothetical protein
MSKLNPLVMRGLDPRIHRKKNLLLELMDCRVKPANDDPDCTRNA